MPLRLKSIFTACIVTVVYQAAEAHAGDPFARAGYPNHVSRYAKPSNTPRYHGGYVGGGSAWFGEARYYQEDGMWGWDYQGFFPPRRVWLRWTHGRRYQGGMGAYKTDGKKLPLPPVLRKL